MTHALSAIDIFALQTVLIAGCVYILIEILKRLTGKPAAWIVLLSNALLSALGTILCMAPNGWTLDCLGMTVLAGGAAAGIHGTVRSFASRRYTNGQLPEFPLHAQIRFIKKAQDENRLDVHSGVAGNEVLTQNYGNGPHLPPDGLRRLEEANLLCRVTNGPGVGAGAARLRL